ncbi:hypothetical protein [Cellulomonas sp. C5510]|uniref:hypothetical protein n=1 Tax=Cellulomonas sp. C5510 TaxID=2871170 RepID=UPI001C95ADB7|nr:hypothetical protein [Cellulomonas sp. C5510]QZN85119.1 hypothetical protein K5O09_15200 [Cellulomonas sp. C5510]
MSDTDGRQPHADDASRAGDGGPRWPSLPEGGSPSARRARRAAHAGDVDPAPTPATPVASAPAGTDPRPASGAHAAVPAATPRTAGTGTASPAGPDQPSGTPEAPAGDGADDAPARSGRRRALVVGGVVAGVVLVGGGIAAALLLRGDGAEPAAGPAPVVTLPSPTSTATPVAREADTPFAAALPTTVLQYALADSAPDDEWLGADALEAWSETYSDGGSGTVTVRAGQWETAEEAAAVLAGLRDALPAVADAAGGDATSTAPATDAPSAGATGGGPAVLLEGDVVVAGEPVGAVTVVDAGDGTGVAVWSNGTAVFRVAGPAVDIRNLYAAYPL